MRNVEFQSMILNVIYFNSMPTFWKEKRRFWKDQILKQKPKYLKERSPGVTVQNHITADVSKVED